MSSDCPSLTCPVLWLRPESRRPTSGINPEAIPRVETKTRDGAASTLKAQVIFDAFDRVGIADTTQRATEVSLAQASWAVAAVTAGGTETHLATHPDMPTS
jgi:hypothetical protein